MASQWYDPYKYYINLDETDFFCIAPTASGRRCNWDVSSEELAEANFCKANAARMPPGPERDYELQRHVLSRLCGDHHREKLSARADAARCCLEDVGLRMSDMMANPALNAPRSLRYGRQRTPLPASAMRMSYSGQPRNRLSLSPRISVPRTTLRASEVQSLSPFVPYVREPEVPMNTVFRDNAALEMQKGNLYGSGHVYIFSWPDHPGFVKIGYTTGSVWDRLRTWTECHPGLKCAYEEHFSFPKRMEKLIHLELRHSRRKIEICPRLGCGSTHHEWFEVSVQQAIDTVAEWGHVARRAPIYGSYGTLTDTWLARMEYIQDEISASMLNALLDHEEPSVLPAQLVQAVVATSTAQTALAAQAATVATSAHVVLADKIVDPAQTANAGLRPADSVRKEQIVLKPSNEIDIETTPFTSRMNDETATVDQVDRVREIADDILLAFHEFMGLLHTAEPKPDAKPASGIAQAQPSVLAVAVC